MLFIVAKLRKKFLLGLRLLLFAAILVVLAGQLWNFIQFSKFYGSWFEERTPNGNPMRVEKDPPREEPGLVESMVRELKIIIKKDINENP